MKIQELINQNIQMLKKAGIIEHNLESELILMHILNWEKAVLISNLNCNLNDNEISKNNKISLAIDGFTKSLKTYFKSGKLNVNEIKVFKGFWGHGTSQISVLKC